MKKFVDHTHDFASNSTTHGFSHILAAKHWYSKFLWIITFLSFFAALCYNLHSIIKSFGSNSILTTIEKKSVSQIEFPAVTICSNGIFLNSEVLFPSTHMSYWSGKDLADTSSIDLRMRNLFVSLSNFQDLDQIKDATPQGESLFMSNFYSACMFGIHKYCRYPQDFKVVSISPYEGNCFTFNYNGTFKQESEGSYYGLSLMMYINQSNMAPFTSFDEGGGISVTLHDKNEFPFPLDHGILLKPGTNTRISLRKRITKRLESPYSSNCSTGKDLKLVFPGKYTLSNCKRSCMKRHTWKKCHAIDPITGKYFGVKEQALNLSQYLCIFESISKVTSKIRATCKCPVPCEETHFSPTISSSMWPSQTDLSIYKRIFHSALGIPAGITDEYVYQNFLRVNIFYEDLAYEVIQEKKEWTSQKLISDVGGQMGIWIGASLFSLVEIMVLVFHLFRGVILGYREKMLSVSAEDVKNDTRLQRKILPVSTEKVKEIHGN